MVLTTLADHYVSLPSRDQPAALAQLLAGNAVELTVGHMTEAGLDMKWLDDRLDIFHFFLDDAEGRERLCKRTLADQLMKWFAIALPEVSGMVMREISEMSWGRGQTGGWERGS